MRSAFRKEQNKMKSSKRSGASADEVYKPSLWYFNELLFIVDQDTPDQSRSTQDEKYESYDNEEKHCKLFNVLY
jgi:hypothetical protein